MSKEKRSIVYIDGSKGDIGDSPVAVIYEYNQECVGEIKSGIIADPILNSTLYGNLYGRIISLVEATTDSNKINVVKPLFTKELDSWSREVYDSAREIATSSMSDNICHSISNNNLYHKNNIGRLL